MERTIDNRECSLYGTRYCDLLNMRTCAQCPMVHMKEDETEAQLRRDLDVYEQLLPEGGVAHLFTEEGCQFCKDKRNHKQGYAIFDMAHPEPKRMKSVLLFGKRRSAVGTMIPVQLGICKRCRHRLLWLSYLPIVAMVVMGALLLALLSIGAWAERLTAINPMLPIGIWLGGIVLGYAAARLLRRILKQRYRSTMYVSAMEHPTVRRMTKMGWFAIPKGDEANLVFSKSRIASGLGTATGVRAASDEADA